MAASRKLLVEIEKCFKKIDEGVEIFEEIMLKITDANSENQREKLQDDLKKEIKKLQRLREQVKGWQNSSEIKDKEKLNQYRKLIEHKMETFKDIERENKTKPHSKQGLANEERLDPKEKQKAEALEWLNTQIRKIQDEIDRTESKIESCSSAETGKKRGKGKDDKKQEKEKAEELKRHLDRVKFHLQNLEVAMRLIMNEKLDVEDLNNTLKEPLELYIEALDPDNDEDPSNLEPDDIYEELGLNKYISQLGSIALQHLEDEKEQSKARHTSGEMQKTTRSKSITSNSAMPTTPVTPTSAPAHPRVARQTSGENASLSSPPPQTPPPTLQRSTQNSVTYAAVSSGANNSRPAAPNTAPVTHTQPTYASAAAPIQHQRSSAPTTIAPLTMPTASTTQTQSAVGTPVESVISSQSASVASPMSGSVNSPLNTSVTPSYANIVASGANSMTPPPIPIETTAPIKQVENKPEEKPLLNQEINSKNFNDLLSEQMRDYMSLDENVPKTPQTTTISPWMGGLPLGEIQPNDDMMNSLRLFEAVAQKAPTLNDTEKQRSGIMPKTPCQTAPYYPQKVQSNFETLEYYTRLQPETLFFTFYFMEGTKAQLLAAKALKKLAWRYHTKYLTWFQRHEEPKQITDDYELGAYIYFDFEKWCEKEKSENFTFEYKFLEDKDVD
ncbi:hypothetical protein M3Y97_00846500 [Aphelenchoides bicaudatus]|nr:hypothetical protein M3Y97_00846500 [Aphelenchoides bicaudatus]